MNDEQNDTLSTKNDTLSTENETGIKSLDQLSEQQNLDSAKQRVENYRDGKPENTPADFFIDEETKFDTGRPEWVDKKFSSFKDLSTSYKKLQKKFGAFKGAPKEYSTEFMNDLKKDINTDDDRFKNFQEWAKSKSVDQDSFEELVGLYVGMAPDKKSFEEYTSKMEPKQIEDLAKINEWLDAKGLDVSQKLAIQDALVSNDSFLDAIGKLRNYENNAKQTAPSIRNNQHSSVRQIESVIYDGSKNIERYRNDPAYRNAIQQEILANNNKK